MTVSKRQVMSEWKGAEQAAADAQDTIADLLAEIDRLQAENADLRVKADLTDIYTVEDLQAIVTRRGALLRRVLDETDPLHFLKLHAAIRSALDDAR